MVMENWLWIIAIPLIHLYQNVIGPENAFNWDFEPDVEPFHFKAGVEQTFNDALTFDDFTTETLELPHTDVDERPLTSEPAALGIPGPAKTSLWDPHRSQFELPHFTDDQSPLPTLPAALGPLGPTQPVFGDRYGVQNDFPAQSTTSHSPRNILFGSASLKRIPEAYLEAAASKRLKTQEPLAHHPPSSLNYIPSSHELPINEYSQPSEGPSIASTDTNYRMEQIGDGSGLHHSMIFPSHGQRTQDHLIDYQSPLSSLQAGLGELGRTKPALGDRYGAQFQLPTESSTSHSILNVLLRSTSHSRISEPYIEAAASKRPKTQVPLAQHSSTSLNYIPPSHELPIDSYSQPFEGPHTASTDTNYHGEKIGHRPRLHRSMIFSTDGQHATDHVAWPSLNHQIGSFQTGTDQQNNLQWNRNNHPDSSLLETLELGQKNSHETTKVSINTDSENQEPTERVQFPFNQPIPTMLHASHSLRENTQVAPFQWAQGCQYRWVNFQPLTIHGRVLIQLIHNFRFTDGTSLSKLLPDLNHTQGPGDTIQNQVPQKILCLRSSVPNINKSLSFFVSKSRSNLGKLNAKVERIPTSSRVFMAKYNDRPFSHTDQTTFQAYHQIALSELKDEIEISKQALKIKLKGKKTLKSQLGIFERSIDHLPMYLIYIDLINALIPVHNLDMDDTLLQSYREFAVTRFFELVQELCPGDKKEDLKKNQSDRKSILIQKVNEMLSSPNKSPYNRFLPFIWKAIEYWIITSRDDLDQIKNFEGGPFKKFFNKLVYTAIDKE